AGRKGSARMVRAPARPHGPPRSRRLPATGARGGREEGDARGGRAPVESAPPDVGGAAARPSITDRAALSLQFTRSRSPAVPDRPGAGAQNDEALVALPRRRPTRDAGERNRARPRPRAGGRLSACPADQDGSTTRVRDRRSRAVAQGANPAAHPDDA